MAAITLGLEEELQVIGAGGALCPHDIEAGPVPASGEHGMIGSELHRCALEVQTPICPDVDKLIGKLGALRAYARRRARRQGREVLAAGLHPFSSWLGQQVRGDPDQYPHYARLLGEYADVARGAMSFGLHLHFGLGDPEARIPVMNRLREVLPEVLALSASAPFFEGRDTGLHSWRHSLLDRYPRMGTPDAWDDEQAYFAHVRRLRRLGVLSPEQGLWEDMRLHHRYGTIEVRICDATPSLDRVWLIAALLLCEVATLEREIRCGAAPAVLPRACVEENRWRARRHGLGATWIDWHRDELVGTPTRLRRWLARLAPAAAQLGLLPRLDAALEDALRQGTSADLQRRVFEANGRDLGAVVRHLVAQTAEPATTTAVIAAAERKGVTA
jgi:carboxylate-amine ligase